MNSLFFASPVHDGRVDSSFLCGCIDADRALRAAGIPVQFYFNNGESLISRARNNICKVFLNSVCKETGSPFTHLLMCDSDLGFKASDVELIIESTNNERHPIVAGMAPLKMIDWDAVARAAVAGVAAGDLCWSGSRNVVNAAHYDYANDAFSVVPVKYAGSGFMCITRECLLRFAEAYPELTYQRDYTIGDPAFDATPEVTAFFDCMICPDEKRYLSEDYTFCKRAAQAGMTIHVNRNILLEHIGKYTYRPHHASL